MSDEAGRGDVQSGVFVVLSWEKPRLLGRPGADEQRTKWLWARRGGEGRKANEEKGEEQVVVVVISLNALLSFLATSPREERGREKESRNRRRA